VLYLAKPVNRKPIDRWEYEFLISQMLKKLKKQDFEDVKKIYQVLKKGYVQ
tara:strand:+ start:186 stop:338 length:153 start_codon:yes stop_codon:yes gene_type:complete